MSEYRPDKIESYWQNVWSEKDSFKPRPVSENKPKKYSPCFKTYVQRKLFYLT